MIHRTCILAQLEFSSQPHQLYIRIYNQNLLPLRFWLSRQLKESVLTKQQKNTN
jgi:hypothetical protein